MNTAAPHAEFDLLRSHRLESLDLNLEEYRHKGTSTPHFHLATDNPENVFLVGLRTVPEDSTGVAHILEHTVLCGSEKYPVRDPFFMMIRRSLNTFMNAFTSTDWTAYPFASQNRKDYFNLLDVYLDAVFFAQLHELDFAQEGHRIEFEEADNPDSDLVFKGVVFNEMKGAMSSASSILWQTLSKYLFPNNTYHHNSGGDPEAIPDLTYHQLKTFYDTHYHPSNAVFMTFGDIPAVELQQRFHTNVLQRFEPLDKKISVKKTKRYYAPVRIEEAYPSSEEDTSDKTHVVCGWLLGQSVKLEDRLRAQLVANVLLDNSSSPLQKALETTSLGSSPSPLCGLEDSNLEMVFVCGLEGTEAEHTDAIEKLILNVLTDVATNGVEQSQIDSVLHQLELSQREIRGDGMPFGLQLVLNGLSTAMQRGDTFSALDIDPALTQLRQDLQDPAYFKQLVKSLLVDNPHRVCLTLRPDTNISELRKQAERQRLAEIKAELDDNAAQQVVARAQALAQRQEQIDDPEILPKVTLDDVPADLPIASGTETRINGAPTHFFAQGTNGLVYQDMVIDMPALEDELQALIPYYTGYLTDVGSGGRNYLETQALQAAVTGSLYAYTRTRGKKDDPQTTDAYIFLSGKALLRNSTALSQLMQETISTVKFDEKDRLRELFAQTRAAREQSITGSGHALAMTAAASGMSPVAALSHRLSGLAGIQALKELDERLDDNTNLEQICERLRQIHELVMSAPRSFLIVAEDEQQASILEQAESQFTVTDTNADNFTAMALDPIRKTEKQLWMTNTEVNFCAKAFATVPSAHEDAAALTVLGPFLRNGYLHRAIRETGGAYGGGASHDTDSASFRFYSYRDPRLEDTLDDFEQSIEWLLSTDHEWRNVEEAILNVVASIDKPGSPAGRARSAFQNQLFGRSPDFRRDFRQRILNVSLVDLKRVGEKYLHGKDASVAVITHAGNQSIGKKLELTEYTV